MTYTVNTDNGHIKTASAVSVKTHPIYYRILKFYAFMMAQEGNISINIRQDLEDWE